MSYEIITAESAAASAIKALEVGSTPGLQREKVLAVMKAMPKGEFAYSVSFGKSVVRVTGDGQIMPAPKRAGVSKDSEEVVIGISEPTLSMEEAATLTGVSEKIEAVTVAGSAPANKRGPHGMIRAGLALLVAPGGVGKTPLAHMLARHDVQSYAVVRAGEPLAGYTSNRDRIAKSLALAMYHSSDIVLDSIKDLLSSSGGGAMKGGISREALLDLSSWATTAANLGVTIYVPLNPSSKDLIDAMVEVANSNATTVFSNDGKTGSEWTWSSRTGEGMPRESGKLTFAEGAKPKAEAAAGQGGIAMRADPLSSANMRGIVSRTQSKV